MNYIKRNQFGILKDNIQLETSLISHINDLCINGLSTLKGRTEAAKRLLRIARLVPIMVDENKMLIQTKSLREYDCVLINYYNLLSVVRIDNITTKVIFRDLSEIIINTSFKKIKGQVSLCERLLAFWFVFENVFITLLLIDLLK